MDDLGLVETVDRFGEGIIITVADTPTDGSMPASASRSEYRLDTYWADSTGRCNTFDHIRFKQAVERFCWCAITQRLARPAIKGMRYSAELTGSVLAQICSLRKVLT